MNSPAAAASSIGGSVNSNRGDGMQTLRTGFELARASQLTMVRLQLALHKSNRHAAMQALDNLLDIDAEIEGLAAMLGDAPAHSADDAALSAFIGLQKAAIAAEKHALTGGDLRCAAKPIAASAPGDRVDRADLPAQPPFPDGEAESDDPTGGERWIYGLAVAIVVIVLGCGLTTYLWPASLSAVMSLAGFG